MVCTGNSTSGCDVATIYVIGDVNTLAEVFLGLATIFGTPEWTDSGAGMGSNIGLAMLFALMATAFKGIITQKLELHYMLASMLIFNVFFVPVMPIQVVDYASGRNSGTIPGVPVGVGVVGYASSSLAHYLTDEFAENFSGLDGNGEYSTPLKEGFLDPLVQMLMIRESTFKSFDANLDATMYAYWKNCVSPSIGISNFDLDEFKNHSNPIQYLFNQQNIGDFVTVHYTNDNQEGLPGECHNVAVAIESTLNSASDETKSRVIQGSLLQNTGTGGNKLDFGTYEQSINALLGAAQSAQEFMYRTMMVNYVSFAEKFEASESNNARLYSALITEQVERERIDSAAEATLFLNFMQPMMSVLQFVFYAVSPIMALILVGAPGAGLQKAGMYILFGIWVHSWLPFAAIINAFIQNSISFALTDSNGNFETGMTLNQLPGVYNLVANKLSAASNIMAGVSLLSLALIAGSPFAIAQLGARFANANNVNTDLAAPKTVGVEPAGKLTSAKTWDGATPVNGGSKASQEQQNSSMQFNWQSIGSKQNTYAQEEVASKKAQHDQAVYSAAKLADGWSSGVQLNDAASKGKNFQAQLVTQAMSNTLSKTGLSKHNGTDLVNKVMSSEAVATAIGGLVSAQAGTNSDAVASAQAKVEAAVRKSWVDTVEQSSQGNMSRKEAEETYDQKMGSKQTGTGLSYQVSDLLSMATSNNKDFQAAVETGKKTGDSLINTETQQEKTADILSTLSSSGTQYGNTSVGLGELASNRDNQGYKQVAQNIANGVYGKVSEYNNKHYGNPVPSSVFGKELSGFANAVESAVDISTKSNAQLANVLGTSDPETIGQFRSSANSLLKDVGGLIDRDISPNQNHEPQDVVQGQIHPGEVRRGAVGQQGAAIDRGVATAAENVDNAQSAAQVAIDQANAGAQVAQEPNYFMERAHKDDALVSGLNQLANNELQNDNVPFVSKSLPAKSISSEDLSADLNAGINLLNVGGNKNYVYDPEGQNHNNYFDREYDYENTNQKTSLNDAKEFLGNAYRAIDHNYGSNAAKHDKNEGYRPPMQSVDMSDASNDVKTLGYFVASAESMTRQDFENPHTKAKETSAVNSAGRYLEASFNEKYGSDFTQKFLAATGSNSVADYIRANEHTGSNNSLAASTVMTHAAMEEFRSQGYNKSSDAPVTIEKSFDNLRSVIDRPSQQ